MSARVDASGDAVRVLGVDALFTVTTAGLRSTYGVSRDGRRFLFSTPAAAQNVSRDPPIVIINWLAALGRQ